MIEPALLQAQCAPIIVVSKKVSDCIRPLTSQQVHQEEVLPVTLKRWWTMLQRKVFTAIKGYHQCPLDEVSQMLTTFITPFRRFKLLRAPYGIPCISEHYNHRMKEAFAGLKVSLTTWLSLTRIQYYTPLMLNHLYKARPEVDFAGFHWLGDGRCIEVPSTC